MSRFILLDHSLSGLAGHHYAYAQLVLGAAREAGFETVLVANRELGELAPDFPAQDVRRAFRYTTYSPYTYDARHALDSGGWRALRRKAIGTFTHAARTRRILAFAEDCAALCDGSGLEDGDVVMAATMSELDFAGLARWLAAEPRSRKASVHVLFHLNLFRGREGDYAAQRAQEDKVRSVFVDALRGLSGHRLRMYCTTEPLARQYERLGVGRFEVLPYPVDDAFAPQPEPPGADEPLRVALLGHSRREKGYSHLQSLVDELWEPYLRPGRVQLTIQARPGKVRLRLPAADPGVTPVVFADAGLPRERYIELVRRTDIGLLLYDADRYYTRCSGVLLEMLCAGVSVIVPAGSWLADQIAEPNQLHLDELAMHGPTHVVAHAMRFGAAPHRFELDVPEGARQWLLACVCSEGIDAGSYVRISTQQIDAAGSEIAASSDVLGPRASSRPLRTVVPIARGAQRMELSLSNAFGTGLVALERLEVVPLSNPGAAGAVGRITADPKAAPAILREMFEHREHYRAMSARYAAVYRKRSRAAEVVRRLLA